MRRQQFSGSPFGLAIAGVLFLALGACATPDVARGPLGGPAPAPSATVSPPVLPPPADRPDTPERPDEGVLPDLNRKDNVYFAQGSTDIDDAGRETIRQHAEKLKGNRRLMVILIGHSADGGSTEYKIAIGQKRIDAVAEELAAGGAASRQIRKQTIPSEKSAANRCASEACHQLDRRVELRYIDLKTAPSRRVP